jgi:hypothetical protein
VINSVFDVFTMTTQQLATAEHETVLETVRKNKAVAFLELSSLLPWIDDDRLTVILDDLERDDLVTMKPKDDVLQQIVSATPKSYRL